jgi:hypothetical protein
MMNFGRGFSQGFKSGAKGFYKKTGASSGSFKNFARMQANMSFSQINGLNKQLFSAQF